jgi:hypothetical protein
VVVVSAGLAVGARLALDFQAADAEHESVPVFRLAD